MLTTAEHQSLLVIVKTALQEDIGNGDVSAMLIPASQHAHARVITRQDMVLCGIPWVNTVFASLDNTTTLHWHANEGVHIPANSVILTLHGPTRALLTGERTALNFLQTLSATATHTAKLVALIKNTNAKLLDTRKTIPGLRHAQKYAVRVGGGYNHRQGLYDAFLLKENHIAACGSITQAVKAARAQNPHLPLTIEVENLTQLQEAISAGAIHIMLDNFSLSDIKQAVALKSPGIALEVSGGVTADNILAVAQTGVDFISLGTLTKDIQAIDLSMRLKPTLT